MWIFSLSCSGRDTIAYHRSLKTITSTTPQPIQKRNRPSSPSHPLRKDRSRASTNSTPRPLPTSVLCPPLSPSHIHPDQITSLRFYSALANENDHTDTFLHSSCLPLTTRSFLFIPGLSGDQKQHLSTRTEPSGNETCLYVFHFHLHLPLLVLSIIRIPLVFGGFWLDSVDGLWRLDGGWWMVDGGR